MFAEDRSREEHGWLEYRLDKPLRASMYPQEILERVMTHPAKMNAWLCRDIIEYVSEPGETILDCFGGVGTSLIAAMLGRNTVLIEIEDYYADIIRSCISHLERHNPVLLGSDLNDRNSIRGQMMLVQADNRLAMPIPCNHIITSPPYGDDLFKAADKALNEDIGKMVEQYGKSNQNIGRLNPFIYQQEMKKVYAKMVQSVKVGGTITITHRDRIREGERILYIDSIVRTLVGLGCKVKMLDKWKAPGSIQSRVNEAMGAEVVLDEDIICMQRVK